MSFVDISETRTAAFGMTYAITICFDPSTELLLDSARARLLLKEGRAPKLADQYPPHITLGIFKEIGRLAPADCVAALSKPFPLRTGGLGIFQRLTGFVVYLSIVPSMALLVSHVAIHKGSAGLVSRDSYYDVDEWIPHCTLAMDLSGEYSLKKICDLLDPTMYSRPFWLSRVEMIYIRELNSAPLEVVWSEDIWH
jgi:2'-5' RNA ligase